MDLLLGISFGSAVTYFISGFIMSVYGWKAVFYSTAVLGLTWCTFWKFLMYDRPDLHPRMSTEEREYIKSTTQVFDAPTKVRNFIAELCIWSVLVTRSFAILGQNPSSLATNLLIYHSTLKYCVSIWNYVDDFRNYYLRAEIFELFP